MPRPDVQVRPALAVDPADRDRVTELQTRLLQAPGDTEAALGLADIFMDAHHPDWALAALAPRSGWCCGRGRPGSVVALSADFPGAAVAGVMVIGGSVVPACSVTGSR